MATYYIGADVDSKMTRSGNSPRPAVPAPRLGRCVAAGRQSINRIGIRSPNDRPFTPALSCENKSGGGSVLEKHIHFL
ncbi:MAG: hypothetical protein WAV28_01190 [Sedimentisphaerales bacterium]